LTIEEETVIEIYRDLIPKDKEEIKMLMNFKASNNPSLKKKQRSSTFGNGEQAVTKMNA
jgi:hypothetical protein